MPLKGLIEEQENTCPNSQQPQQPQPMRSAIRARLDHLSMVLAHTPAHPPAVPACCTHLGSTWAPP